MKKELRKEWIKEKLEQIVWIIVELHIEEGEINEGMITEKDIIKIRDITKEIKEEIDML